MSLKSTIEMMPVILSRTMLVFFWGILAAELVVLWHVFIRPIDAIAMPFLVVFVNMFLVFIKNTAMPDGKLRLK